MNFIIWISFFFLATEEEEDEVDYVPDYNEYSIYILPSDRLEIDEVGPRITNINTNKEELIEETYNKITGK